MTHHRQFTAAFKAQIILELLSGAKSGAELCREHQIAASALADWKAIWLSRNSRGNGSKFTLSSC
jgi:transposase-like protein